MAVSETDPKLKNGPWLAVPAALTLWMGNGHDIALAKIAGPGQDTHRLISSHSLISPPLLSSSLLCGELLMYRQEGRNEVSLIRRGHILPFLSFHGTQLL